MVDIVLLQKEIDDLGIPKATLAEKCNMSRYTLDNKIKNPRTITANDCYSLSKALRITDVDKIMRIFFAPNVEENGSID